MAIQVCVAGATGWTGRAVTVAILESSEFQLVGAIARRQVGVDIGEVLDHGRANVNTESARGEWTGARTRSAPFSFITCWRKIRRPTQHASVLVFYKLLDSLLGRDYSKL